VNSVSVRTPQSLRAKLAAHLGCEPSQVSLTRSTTDGCNIVLAGLRLGADDEVVTTDVEHFGLIGPLHASGAKVVTAPEDKILDAVTDRTRLIAVSHVSWVTGNSLDPAGIKAQTLSRTRRMAKRISRLPARMRQQARKIKMQTRRRMRRQKESSGRAALEIDRVGRRMRVDDDASSLLRGGIVYRRLPQRQFSPTYCFAVSGAARLACLGPSSVRAEPLPSRRFGFLTFIDPVGAWLTPDSADARFRCVERSEAGFNRFHRETGRRRRVAS